VSEPVLQADLPGLELLHRGKVRDVFALPGGRLLIVASDRLSAFDVVLPDPIPGKGEMLTQLSNFWFARTAALVPNHLTPSTKAAAGAHDENISFDQVARTIGGELAERVREASLRIYAHAAAHAESRGILIADTKLEFGLDADGTLRVMDEMLTPDSSRFWPADEYRVGSSPPSFDKQFVRDHLETLDWNKQAPGPRLPAAVIEGTRARYAEALKRLM
jgi:phosphoribosylaminoimidazole-succinocarboxamide synthase